MSSSSANLDSFHAFKDPDSVLDYGIDWSTWLGSGDSVSTAAWVITSPSGDSAPIVVDSSSVASNICTAILSGGTAGNTYYARCRITTANGLTEDRTIRIQARNQ